MVNRPWEGSNVVVHLGVHAGPEKQSGSLISGFAHIDSRTAHALEEEQSALHLCAHALKERQHAAGAVCLPLDVTLLGQLLSPVHRQSYTSGAHLPRRGLLSDHIISFIITGLANPKPQAIGRTRRTPAEHNCLQSRIDLRCRKAQKKRCSPQREPEESAGEVLPQGAIKVQEWLESVWELTKEVGALESDLQPGLGRAGARQPFCVRVKHDEIIARDEGWQVRPMIDGIEAQSKALQGNTVH